MYDAHRFDCPSQQTNVVNNDNNRLFGIIILITMFLYITGNIHKCKAKVSAWHLSSMQGNCLKYKINDKILRNLNYKNIHKINITKPKIQK